MAVYDGVVEAVYTKKLNVDNISVIINFKNSGELQWTYALGFSCRIQNGTQIWNSKWATNEIVKAPLGDVKSVTLSVGAESTQTLTFRIPLDFGTGTFEFRVGVWKNVPPVAGDTSLVAYPATGWSTQDSNGNSIPIILPEPQAQIVSVVVS